MSPGHNTDNTWQTYESEIRLLYQTNSLDEVKSMMEAKPGFPKMAVKTWHEKLANHGIRKTVKNEEWAKVYRHCAHYRLEDPSRKRGDKRLKRTKRKTEVIFGNKTFTWDQAWKNMKRAVANYEPQLGPPSPLPSGVTVRTPPYVPSSPNPCLISTKLRLLEEFTTDLKSQALSLSPESSWFREGITLGDKETLIQPSYSSLLDRLKAQMMLHLPGLPIWTFCNTLVEMADLDLRSQNSTCKIWYDATVSLTPPIVSPINCDTFSEIQISNESVFHLSDLFSSLAVMQPSAALATFSTRDRAYITVSIATYILSNNLVVPAELGSPSSVHKGFFENLDLDSAFAEIPARHLRAILQSRQISSRAAFEALLNISGQLKQRSAFKSLVEIGTSNNWLSTSARGHQYLSHAVSMDLDETVQLLLEMGCRPDRLLSLESITTATFEAFGRGNIQCAQQLLKHCDVNSKITFQFPLEWNNSSTSFTYFLRLTRFFNSMLLDQGIKLFLDAGADINSTFLQDREWDDEFWYAPAGRRRFWSVLDYLFCFHPRLFYKFAPHWSPVQDSQPTRAGILMSLAVGPKALNEYCDGLAQSVGRARLHVYLELLVADQLTGAGPWRHGPSNAPNLRTVRSLVNWGVGMDRVLSHAPCLLAHYMNKTRERSGEGVIVQYDLEVMQFLLRNGAPVTYGALQEAVRGKNTDILALILQNIRTIRYGGARAVFEAAIANNLEAVKILLDAGVDVNTVVDFSTEGLCPKTSNLLCQLLKWWRKPFQELKDMIDYLVQRGAHFRLFTGKPHPADLAAWVLQTMRYPPARAQGLLKSIVLYIIDADCDLSDPDVPSARLLEACGSHWRGDLERIERMEIFESMLRNGALLRPGAPLAAWIDMGGGTELVNMMLSRGVDIDAYQVVKDRKKTALQAAAERCSEELVVLLLQNGADVNAPARGERGRTALQYICKYGPQTPAKKAQQISIINILLAYGANINAAPARAGGLTALQSAATSGNLEVTMLLLSCNPPADVNAPECKLWGQGNSLDLAASNGRLDVVKLLLNNGAISGRPGHTGYDGAIQKAESKGFLAIANLIRQHAMDAFGSDIARIYLSQPQRDWKEYEYDDSSEGYTDCDEDEDDEDTESEHFMQGQNPVTQVQIQPETIEYPCPKHTAPEPGWVWDWEADHFPNFDIGFVNLAEDIASTCDFDSALSTSHVDTTASDWGLGQWPNTGSI